MQIRKHLRRRKTLRRRKILLLALFAATLIVGVFGGPDQASTLHALIFADVVVPVVIYAYLLFVKQMKRKEMNEGQDTGRK